MVKIDQTYFLALVFDVFQISKIHRATGKYIKKWNISNKYFRRALKSCPWHLERSSFFKKDHDGHTFKVK